MNLHYLYIFWNLLITLLPDIAWYMPVLHKQEDFWILNFFLSNDVEPKIYIQLPYYKFYVSNFL